MFFVSATEKDHFCLTTWVQASLENCKKKEMKDFEFLLVNEEAPTSGHEPEGMCPKNCTPK